MVTEPPKPQDSAIPIPPVTDIPLEEHEVWLEQLEERHAALMALGKVHENAAADIYANAHELFESRIMPVRERIRRMQAGSER